MGRYALIPLILILGFSRRNLMHFLCCLGNGYRIVDSFVIRDKASSETPLPCSYVIYIMYG